MKKKSLLTLAVTRASDAAVSLAKLLTNAKTKYIVNAVVRIIDHQKVLVLDFCSRNSLVQGSRELQYRAFITKQDHLTADFTYPGVKWRTGTIYTVTGERLWWRYQPYICQDTKAQETILRYLKASLTADPFDAIDRMQQQILQRRLKKRHRRITDAIDAQMRTVPSLPRGFSKWLDREVMTHSKYIFYNYRHGQKKQNGFCTWCRHEVELSSPRYNQEEVCPHCGEKMVFKTEKKCGTFCDENLATVLQKCQDGIVVRRFEVRKWYRKDSFREPELDVFEYERTLFDAKGDAVQYAWLDFKNTGYRWCYGSYWNRDGVLYTANLREVLEHTPWQYSHIYDLIDHGTCPSKIAEWLYNYAQNPYVEYLYKLGLTNLTARVLEGIPTHMNRKGKTLTEVLGIKKEYVPLLRDLNASNDQLKCIQTASNYGIRLTPDLYRKMERFFDHRMQAAVDILRFATFRKVDIYINRQKDTINRGRKNQQTLWNVTGDWMDYVRGCEELGYDLNNNFVLFPKHLTEAHDLVTERVNRKREDERKAERERLNAATRKHFEVLQEQYGWERDGLMVRAPESMDAIIKEGQEQHHCVGNYAESAANGETIILFVRKAEEPENPYYTMEIKKRKITQCRGYENDGMTPEVKRFIQVFAEEKSILAP